MRTVYLGTSSFGAAVLERLGRSPHSPTLVVTRPDRPRGRGRRLASPPVALTARELGIALDQPESVNSVQARERIAAERPEAVLICAFGALIKEPLLSDYPMLNVHPSLLPRWRGAAPIERAIMAGDELTGVSIMRPIEEMDAGPVLLQAEQPVGPDDDFATLSERLERLGGDLLVRALDEQPEPRAQPAEGVTLADKITSEDRALDPALGAEALSRRVRALTPHVGAYIELPGHERLGVRRALPAGGHTEPGALRADDGRLLYGCADGALELLEVQPAGGRPMDAGAWLRGHAAKLA